jgi:anthranilate phosphoribosyltransferase
MSAPTAPTVLLDQLLRGEPLSGPQAAGLMRGWLERSIDPVLSGALLAALRCRGVDGEVLAAMAAELREACPVPAGRPAQPLVDTCGTGGDGRDTFNISTAVAFTAAACGACVAKHGNRSASGRVGSADVLEALGLPLDTSADRVVAVLPRSRVTFLFAPGWHPALAPLAPVRRSLGVRTVFNLLGPLVNPLRPEAQVLGVARPDLLDPMAEALQRLGLARAVVVHGHDGLDEASLSGPSELRLVAEGEVRIESLDPVSLGLSTASVEALAGGDVATNATILEQVLRGRGSAPQRDVVVLNTALVLWAAGIVEGVGEGVAPARRALDSGAAWQRLEALRDALATPAAVEAG